MTTLSAPDRPLRAQARGRAVREAVERGDEEQLRLLLDEVSDAAATDMEDVAALAIERDRVGRLLETLSELPRSEARGYAEGRLHEVDRLLDRRRTLALGARAQQERARRKGTLRAELVKLLRRPQRPGDLARRLGADPAQVSRVLRALEHDGLVEAQVDEHDGRGRVYALRDSAALLSR